jgi:hypothetical protein
MGRPPKPKALPNDVVLVIGLCWQGYTSVAEISLIAGLQSTRVRQIIESQDDRIRRALRVGLSSDTARLDVPIRCRGCHSLIDRVPCVTCRCGGGAGG